MSEHFTTAVDSRDETLRHLEELLSDTLRISLVVQLCARGSSLKQAIKQLGDMDDTSYKKLTTGDGGSGYLNFQWISESLLKVQMALSKINLSDFWAFVEAKQDTRKVYEVHLEAALIPLNDNSSGVRRNLKELYDEYPNNKVTSESLPLLKQIKDSADRIEATIKKLLSLSPPAKRRTPQISRKLVIGTFVLFILSLPIFYWLKLDSRSPSSVATQITRDVEVVQKTAVDNPIGLPKLILTEITPMASNLLLLVSALLGIGRAFSKDSQKDTTKMSDELTKAAKTLRDLA